MTQDSDERARVIAARLLKGDPEALIHGIRNALIPARHNLTKGRSTENIRAAHTRIDSALGGVEQVLGYIDEIARQIDRRERAVEQIAASYDEDDAPAQFEEQD